MYKLFKIFNAKAKQLSKEREKKAGDNLSGGVKSNSEVVQEVEFVPIKLTQSIQEQITTFKVCGVSVCVSLFVRYMCVCLFACLQENLPVVHILCNPGLRTRHWDQMNAITGFSITPDSGTSLRKMLKYNLEPHFDTFEGALFSVHRVWV